MEFLAEIHSKLIHFPIALFVIYPFIEFLFFITNKEYFSKTSFLFLILGVISAFFSVLSGNQAFECIINWSANSKQIFEQHQYYANLTVWFFTALLLIKFILFKKYSAKRIIALILFLVSLTGLFFVYQTGHYGGLLAREVTIKTENPITD